MEIKGLIQLINKHTGNTAIKKYAITRFTGMKLAIDASAIVYQSVLATRASSMVVGDGINDSLALRAGAVGVAMGTQGAEVAFASADLALMTNDLRRLGTCIRLSRRCRRTIYVNVSIGLAFTFGLIVLSGAGVLGIEAPIIAALLHNVSTFIGIANAGRLLLFDETLATAPVDTAA